MKDLEADGIRQRIFSEVFGKLVNATEDCKKEAIQAANNQNAIVLNSMFSGPEKQMMFRNAKFNFENKKVIYEIHQQLLELFQTNRDDTGYFTNFEKIQDKLEGMLKEASQVEQYPVVEIVSKWRNMLPG